MADKFETYSSNLSSPAREAATIVPDDAQPLPNASRGIYVGTSGDLRLSLVGAPDEAITLASVQAGAFYPLRVDKVYATGTTADGLVALW